MCTNILAVKNVCTASADSPLSPPPPPFSAFIYLFRAAGQKLGRFFCCQATVKLQLCQNGRLFPSRPGEQDLGTRSFAPSERLLNWETWARAFWGCLAFLGADG
ncbi:hypothetical protein BaRGS_00014601 [Batillaria attramentaria]|uniref:Uncharacterized protein n=1 Tax=Batillaria attramentaria TaxID=370345 RepID=A0ABD0L4A4_9CAEN